MRAFRRGLLGFGSFGLLLSACQARQPAGEARAVPTVQAAVAPRPAAGPPAADRSAKPGRHPAKPTLFPDTLHPVELAVNYWTSAQLDSIRAVLEADSVGQADGTERWDAQLRVLRTDEYTGKRLFFRPLVTSPRWVEVDLNAWLQNYNSLPYLSVRAVELDQRPPEELLVEVGGSFAGQGQHETEGYTLLLAFEGPPRLIWHSLDEVTEEIAPTQTGENGEMEGGNYARAGRELTVRKGQVRVGRVRQEGRFTGGGESGITPITPGRYAYRGGRFRRVGRSDRGDDFPCDYFCLTTCPPLRTIHASPSGATYR